MECDRQVASSDRASEFQMSTGYCDKPLTLWWINR
jgi:hypothetical protein